MLLLAKYPEMLTAAAQDFAPHDVTFYLRNSPPATTATMMRNVFWWRTCGQARTPALVAATAQVLHNGLAVLGVECAAKNVSPAASDSIRRIESRR